jgi:hypothetical protein
VQAVAHCLGECFGGCDALERLAAIGALAVLQQGAQQQRVAAGDVVALGGEPGRGGGREVAGQHGGGALGGQHAHLDPGAVRLAQQVGVEGQLLLTQPGGLGQHDQYPCLAYPSGQVEQELQGVVVGVVHIVDGDDDGPLPGELQQRPGGEGHRAHSGVRRRLVGCLVQQPYRVGTHLRRYRGVVKNLSQDTERQRALGPRAGGVEE